MRVVMENEDCANAAAVLAAAYLLMITMMLLMAVLLYYGCCPNKNMDLNYFILHTIIYKRTVRKICIYSCIPSMRHHLGMRLIFRFLFLW